MSKSKPKTEPSLVRVGQIVGTHGVKGGLKVLPLTDFPSRFDQGASLWIKGVERKITRSRWHKGQARIQVEGINDMNTAESLKWVDVEVPSDSRPEMEEEDHLVSDLIGMSIVDDKGVHLGVVEEVVAAPAQDLLKFGNALVPMVSDFIKKIDPENRQVTVSLIPGMLDDNEAEVASPDNNS